MRRTFFILGILIFSWMGHANYSYAQVSIEYQKKTKNSTLTITAVSGLYYGYGYYGTFSPGIVLQRGNSTILFGTNFSGSSLPLYVNPYSARSFLYGSGYYYPYAYRYSSYPGLSSPSFSPYPRDPSSAYWDLGVGSWPLLPLYPRDPSPISPNPIVKRERVSGAMTTTGMALLKEAKYVEAEKALRAAIGSGSSDPEVKFLFGMALMGQGEYTYSAKAVRRALNGATDPRWIETLNCETLFKDTAETTKLIVALQKRSRLGDTEASLLLTIMLFASGDKEGATKEIGKLSGDPIREKLHLFMRDSRLR